ncbi:MAG: lasso peptide biosynthesis PqqD family chaperone [Wenzhouxiangella sp.]|jgi:hypothetical protein|nr:lasso peptide biosynthesis PqqD family chaperone [Wenzhouxiangella sp.]
MSNELNPESTVQRSSEPLQAGLDDEVVMMSVEKGSYYGLDPVGARIWELIESPKRISQVVDDLIETYEVDREVCERETLAFMQSLIDEDLAQIVD